MIAVHLPATLDRAAIAQRIPHHGRMCLLDSVSVWDAQHIVCQASNHQAGDHPLRSHGRLGAACGIEYAAQAMAVHGALVAQANASDNAHPPAPRSGYLASVRSVVLSVDRLDTAPGPLTISAERLGGDEQTVLYGFEVHAGAQSLVTGRAVVVLDAATLGLPPIP